MVSPRGRSWTGALSWTRALAVLAAALVAAAALATGCTSSGPTPGPTQPSAAEALAAVKAKVDAASSLHLTLTGKDLPASMTGVVSAEGSGTHAPAFQGSFQVRLSGGTQASADVVAVGGKVYVKLPFAPIHTQVDPSTLGAPDPAALFSPDTGLTSLLTATQDPVKGPQTRRGSEVLTTYSGALAGAKVADLLFVGDRTGTFAATYGVTDPGGELRTVDLTGPFYAGAQSTYSLTLDRYGEPVAISTP